MIFGTEDKKMRNKQENLFTMFTRLGSYLGFIFMFVVYVWMTWKMPIKPTTLFGHTVLIFVGIVFMVCGFVIGSLFKLDL